LESLLFQVRPENPILFGAAALLMIAVSIAAALAPSLRAARIDPMTALRHE
jgi:ABC-type antimicrobial peptide transport system permease subunit